MSLTPPLLHFTLTFIASEIPFSARPRPLPVCTMNKLSSKVPKLYLKVHERDFYLVPSRDAGVAPLQTSSLDFSLGQPLPSDDNKGAEYYKRMLLE